MSWSNIGRIAGEAKVKPVGEWFAVFFKFIVPTKRKNGKSHGSSWPLEFFVKDPKYIEELINKNVNKLVEIVGTIEANLDTTSGRTIYSLKPSKIHELDSMHASKNDTESVETEEEEEEGEYYSDVKESKSTSKKTSKNIYEEVDDESSSDAENSTTEYRSKDVDYDKESVTSKKSPSPKNTSQKKSVKNEEYIYDDDEEEVVEGFKVSEEEEEKIPKTETKSKKTASKTKKSTSTDDIDWEMESYSADSF